MTPSEKKRIIVSKLSEIKRTGKKERIYSRSAERGTSMINQIEDKASAPIVVKSNKPVIENPLRDKVKALLNKFPENSFYQSLSKWKGSFTPSQSSSIEKNYERWIQSPTEAV